MLNINYSNSLNTPNNSISFGKSAKKLLQEIKAHKGNASKLNMRFSEAVKVLELVGYTVQHNGGRYNVKNGNGTLFSLSKQGSNGISPTNKKQIVQLIRDGEEAVTR